MEAARDHTLMALTHTNAPGIYETGTFVMSQLDISHGLTFTSLPVSCAWREWPRAFVETGMLGRIGRAIRSAVHSSTYTST